MVAGTTLRSNLVANLMGSIWSAALSVALVPFYIYYLGVEAYGLVGFYALLQSTFVLFDAGMSTTLNREIARLTAVEDTKGRVRGLVRTFEILAWAIALAISSLVIVGAPALGSRWIQPDQLPVDTVVMAIRLMGLVAAIQFPIALYTGGLLGTERHLLLNGINGAAATFRHFGAILVLAWISPSITVFFLWQAVATGLQTAALSFGLHKSLPPVEKPVGFSFSRIREVRLFALGMSGITITGTIIAQFDKLALSHLLPLDEFGVYVVASTAASSVLIIVSPFFLSVFPRLSTLLARDEESQVIVTYHRTAQFLSALLLPCVFVLAFFPEEILQVWTGNSFIARQGWPIVSLLVLGYGLSGLYNVPNALQIASGWTSLALRLNVWAIIVLVPLAILGAIRFGAMGVATFWVLVNLGYVTIGVNRMHRRLLPAEQRKWWVDDLARPGMAALAVVILGRLSLSDLSSRIGAAIAIGLILMLAIGVSFISTRYTRDFVREVAAQGGLRWSALKKGRAGTDERDE